MNALSSLVTNVKLWWGVAGGIILLIADKKFGPSEEDLPTSLKSILAILCVAEIYLLLSSNASVSQRSLLLAAMAVLVFAAFYTYFSFVTTYTKLVQRPAPWWRFWNKDNITETIKVVGGRLTQQARDSLKSTPRSVDDYFSAVAYNEDLVWSRWSRGINKTVLFLLYSAFILSAAACLVIPAQTIAD
jgi:hypothetical protein